MIDSNEHEENVRNIFTGTDGEDVINPVITVSSSDNKQHVAYAPDTRLEIEENKEGDCKNSEIQERKQDIIEEEIAEKRDEKSADTKENAETDEKEASLKSKLGIEMLEFVWNFILSGQRSKSVTTQTLQLVSLINHVYLEHTWLGHQYLLGNLML